MRNALIIGGTGIISTAVVRECLNRGYTLTIINRGRRSKDNIEGVSYVVADVRYEPIIEIKRKLGSDYFDVVIDFLSYNLKQLKKTIQWATCGQYIFISSSSIYEEDEGHLYSEHSKKGNIEWDYCKNKYACECELPRLAETMGFKYTIVRPYVTYSNKRFPYQFSPLEYYTIIYRIQHNIPLPIISPEGETTVTDSRDFANGLVGLIGNNMAYDTDFNITTDHHIRWREIADMMAEKFGVNCNYVVIDIKKLKNYKTTIIDIPELLCDKSRIMTFDNSKIKNAVPNFVADRTIDRSIEDIYKNFIVSDNPRFNFMWTGCLDRMIYEFNGLKIDAKVYPYKSNKDKIMYIIGRNKIMCFAYNIARKIKKQF